MFQVVNNGVHWASDYPLRIGMGYIFGRAATQILIEKNSTKEDKKSSDWKLYPTLNGLYALREF